MPEFTDKTFKALAGTQFIDIAYREWGAADNPKVAVCVHGLSRNLKDFDDLARALAPEWRVLSVDMPGRGKSAWLDDKSLYGYPLYESVCVGLIAASGADEVAWIGTSMGGNLGMRLAARPGAPISRLVLNDIGPFVPAEGRRHNQADFGKDPRFASEAEGVAHVRATRGVFGPFTEAGWEKFGKDSLRRLEDGQWTLHYDPGLAGGGPITDSDMWDIWPDIRIPVLTIWGEESKILTAATVDRMTKSGPRTLVYAVPGVGHCPGLTTKGEIDAIAGFIGG